MVSSRFPKDQYAPPLIVPPEPSAESAAQSAEVSGEIICVEESDDYEDDILSSLACIYLN